MAQSRCLNDVWVHVEAVLTCTVHMCSTKVPRPLGSHESRDILARNRNVERARDPRLSRGLLGSPISVHNPGLDMHSGLFPGPICYIRARWWCGPLGRFWSSLPFEPSTTHRRIISTVDSFEETKPSARHGPMGSLYGTVRLWPGLDPDPIIGLRASSYVHMSHDETAGHRLLPQCSPVLFHHPGSGWAVYQTGYYVGI